MKESDCTLGALLLITGVVVAIGFNALVVYDILNHGVEKRAKEQEIRSERLENDRDRVAERTRQQQEQAAENLRKQQEDMNRRQQNSR